ncbi:phage baseplate assembly protein V [Actinoplanes sp. NEAU-A12]|uniref:Phage baseplate assembly protein V n=1 Tax=Actinoplanes sandaracinus TaxID=3045177 RepID=A0ABT6WWK0_9ACTN|nr:phage baseplate assembly protein V [Actinoplanes sandaracinus]MDI6104123.1 phage baseplate assembly protein V [Actinoplanes sandaracinus]
MDVDPLEQLIDWVRYRQFGKYRGTVTDNADPTTRARLKVRVPAVLGDLEVWAMPCVPYAGAKVGLFMLPEAGTGVWVEFEGGDPSYPLWSGFFWADDEVPDAATGAPAKVLRTGSSTVVLDDDVPEVRLAVDDAGELTIGDDVVTKRDKAVHTVSTDGVRSEMGGQSVAVTQSSVSVDDGALEVK